jgi:hypothetical protein
VLPPFRQPLPPLLAKLHALLEEHVEAVEEGILIIEQDRRPQLAAGLPVIVFVPARPQAAAASGRVAPELIAELVVDPADRSREGMYARAGVREYWRVDAEKIVIQHDAKEGRFTRSATYAQDEAVVSEVMPGLRLRPRDLAT